MMRMTVLASGSKGNSTVISSSRTRVLVDAGLSCRELLKRMSIAGEDPGQLDAILITHEHQDHIAGLSVLARRLNIPVFFTEPTHRAWVRMLTPRSLTDSQLLTAATELGMKRIGSSSRNLSLHEKDSIAAGRRNRRPLDDVIWLNVWVGACRCRCLRAW